MIAEYRKLGLFGPVFWLRPVVVAGVLLAAALLVLGRLWPGVQWPTARLMAALFVVPALLVLHVALHVTCPRHVRLSGRGIHVTHGQSGALIRPERVLSVTLRHGDKDGRRLVAIYLSRCGIGRTLESAIPAKINQAKLDAALRDLGPPASHVETAAEEGLTLGATRSA